MSRLRVPSQRFSASRRRIHKQSRSAFLNLRAKLREAYTNGRERVVEPQSTYLFVPSSVQRPDLDSSSPRELAIYVRRHLVPHKFPILKSCYGETHFKILVTCFVQFLEKILDNFQKKLEALLGKKFPRPKKKKKKKV